MAEKDKPSDTEFTWTSDEPVEEKEKTSSSLGARAAGAAAQGVAAYKGVNLFNALRPAPGLFAPSPTPLVPALRPPANIPEVQGIDDILRGLREDEVKRALHGSGSPSSRARTDAFNTTTSLRSEAWREAMGDPGAKKILKDFGTQVPVGDTNIVVQENVARKLADQDLLEEARRRVEEQTRAREAALAAEAQAAAAHAAENAAAENATRTAARRGIMSGLGHVGSNVLGGLFTLPDAWEAYQSYQNKEPIDETAAKAATAAGGALMLGRDPRAKIAGGALIGGGLSYPYLKYLFNEYMRDPNKPRPRSRGDILSSSD
ncbi:hypothetical protein UFOVP239_50 [uncultured Caudovirales phage]|uniref:Uncharacterized protein n=1 Tax=uncultured Caudovirales phage TaxID=2100421 RepID=A0A6J7WVE9_9CAUD|nr:hypothetical protein UFOVP239_50 [uncultured Caudovirales phage]